MLLMLLHALLIFAAHVATVGAAAILAGLAEGLASTGPRTRVALSVATVLVIVALERVASVAYATDVILGLAIVVIYGGFEDDAYRITDIGRNR